MDLTVHGRVICACRRLRLHVQRGFFVALGESATQLQSCIGKKGNFE